MLSLGGAMPMLSLREAMPLVPLREHTMPWFHTMAQAKPIHTATAAWLRSAHTPMGVLHTLVWPESLHSASQRRGCTIHKWVLEFMDGLPNATSLMCISTKLFAVWSFVCSLFWAPLSSFAHQL